MFQIQGNSGFTYFINYADDFLNCSGRICRNNVAIGLTSSSCVLFLRNDTDGGITISSVQAHICDSGMHGITIKQMFLINYLHIFLKSISFMVFLIL